MSVVFDAGCIHCLQGWGCSGGQHPSWISTLLSLIINVKSVLSDDNGPRALGAECMCGCVGHLPVSGVTREGGLSHRGARGHSEPFFSRLFLALCLNSNSCATPQGTSVMAS